MSSFAAPYAPPDEPLIRPYLQQNAFDAAGEARIDRQALALIAVAAATRNMIGAVVGTQPFGGSGLSGRA